MLERGEELERGERRQVSRRRPARSRRGRARPARGRGRAARSSGGGSPACSASRGRPPTSICWRSRLPRISRARASTGFRDAREARHLHAVRAVGRAVRDLAQEDDLAVPFLRGHRAVLRRPASRAPSPSARGSASRRGRAAIAGVVKVLGDRPREREAVERGRAAPDLVEDDEARAPSRAAGCARSRPSRRGTSTRPRTSESDAPTRVKMRSVRPIVADTAGTNEPACARRTRSAFCLRYVDLPPMFGPVRTTRCSPSPPSAASFGTKGSRGRSASTTGWRPPSTRSTGSSTTRGRTQPPARATRARETSASRRPRRAQAAEDARRLRDDLRDEREKQLLLARREARVGGAELLVHLDELGRRVAFDVRERLPLERVLGNARTRRAPAPRRRGRRPG